MKRAGTIKYQHVLSCAQPSHKKVFMGEREQPSEIKSREDLKKKKGKKCTIFEEILKKRGKIDIRADSACACFKPEAEIKIKKMKTKSTIMPIFLKKIKQRREESAEILQHEGEFFLNILPKNFLIQENSI